MKEEGTEERKKDIYILYIYQNTPKTTKRCI